MDPDHCSFFRLKLNAIDKALDYALYSEKENIWIWTDNRNSIQCLRIWTNILD